MGISFETDFLPSIGRNLAIGSDNKCHVELNTKVLSQQQIQSIEDKCNESIRRRVSMTPRWLEPDSKELEEVLITGLYHNKWPEPYTMQPRTNAVLNMIVFIIG